MKKKKENKSLCQTVHVNVSVCELRTYVQVYMGGFGHNLGHQNPVPRLFLEQIKERLLTDGPRCLLRNNHSFST